MNSRVKALDHLIQLLRRAYLAEQLDKHKLSLCDIVEKNIRRTPEEAVRALQLASLLAIQLGLDVEEHIDPVINAAQALCADPAQNEELRAAAAEALGLTAYFGVYRPVKRGECLAHLRQTWYQMKPTTGLQHLFAASLFSYVLILERVSDLIRCTRTG